MRNDDNMKLVLVVGLFVTVIAQSLYENYKNRHNRNTSTSTTTTSSRVDDEYYNKNARAHILRATSQQMLGNHKEACEDFRQALKLESLCPDRECGPFLHHDAEAYVVRGISQQMLGHYKQATEDFQRAISLNASARSGYDEERINNIRYNGISFSWKSTI